jgi:hypothetical protein
MGDAGTRLRSGRPRLRVTVVEQACRDEEGAAVDEGRAISYLSLAVGTPVMTSDGNEIGKVHHVLQVPELDLFDGISVKTRHGLRFVDRDQIAEITTTVVHCSLSDDDAAALPAPDGAPVVELDLAHDEGPSLTARIGRLFGRPHWKNIDE